MTVNKFLAALFIFAIGHISCAVADAAFIGDASGPFVQFINDGMGFNAVSSGGWTMVQMPMAWIIRGIPQMLLWDYTCLTGGFFIVRVFFWIFSLGLIFGLFQTLRSG